MKKRYWVLLLALLVLLAGCAVMPETTLSRSPCQVRGHIWQEASCIAARTCAECAETEGEPLGHDWQEATCTEAKTCARCGNTEGEPAGHVWQDATCTVAKTCADCGMTEGEPAGHCWKEATCTEAQTCTVCGEIQGEPLGHTWQEATCTSPRTCAACGVTEGEMLDHTWQAATCQAPKTCTGCGKTEGSVTDHKWKNATCSKPTTCTVCGKTSGGALGHDWKAATCTMAKTCSICGATSGDPLGHDFAETTDGKTKLCNTCGETVTIKYISITFDDGPSGNITKRLLEGLQQRGVKATFFICGYRINSFPAYPQMILDGGHEIGLHTVNHATLTKLDKDGVRRELEGMLGQLPEGYRVRLMRPPGGSYNSTVKAVCLDMGLSIVMWSVDPQDWATNDVDTIVSRILRGASEGSIILMHDLKSSSVTAALKAIDKLQALGYEFVTVSELAQIMGKTLEPGKVYYSIK